MTRRPLCVTVAGCVALLLTTSCSRQLPASSADGTPLTMKSRGFGSVLITGGFPYWSNDEVTDPKKYDIRIEKVEPGGEFVTASNSVQPVWAGIGGMFLTTRGSTVFAPKCTAQPKYAENPSGCDSVGLTWTFVNAGTTFTVRDWTFTTRRAGATIVFKKKGVLMSGFDISPRQKE